MNQDNRKNNATKHYQNSDYPSGSFEAAINADHKERLSEPQALRLERHPLAPGGSGADLEEMVPAFMHRDFFRSEEEADEAVVSDRLRAPRRPVAPPIYQEPPNTEEGVAPPAPRSPYAPPMSAEPPLAAPTPEAPTAEEPLSPLRSAEAPPAPEPRSAPRPAPIPAETTYPPTVVNPGSQPGESKSPYSMPLLVALALVVGIFVWREQTRPTVAAQEPLAVPKTAQVSPTAAPLPEPTPAGVGFRPTFVAVGPPVPKDGTEEQAGAVPTPSASGEPGAVAPGGEEASMPDGEEAEADERAAILNRVSQAGESSGASEAPAGEPGELFPSEGNEDPAPPKSPVREAGSKGEPQPKAAAPAAKVEPKPVPVSATAADLFPIDEEVPIKPAKGGPPPAAAPAAVSPPEQPVPAAGAGAPPAEGYRIDEPNL